MAVFGTCLMSWCTHQCGHRANLLYNEKVSLYLLFIHASGHHVALCGTASMCSRDALFTMPFCEDSLKADDVGTSNET